MSNIKASYVDHMGTDASVVNAARISMDKQAHHFTDKQNQSLLNYLAMGQSSKDTEQDIIDVLAGVFTEEEIKSLLLDYKNRSTHWTPFAHTAITLRVSAPVPIRTQAFKHKQGLVENEESRRYITSKPEIFITDGFRTKPENVKQGSGGLHEDSDWWEAHYMNSAYNAVNLYENMILNGIAPEQARFVLPQGTMVNWIWTGNLYSFVGFYLSRTDPHAQKEISELAEQIKSIIEPLYPMAWKALTQR